MRDGIYDLVFIPDLTIQVGDTEYKMDALLCPQNHAGYTSRLFLTRPITERPTINGQPANWSVCSFAGRSWHSWSWQGVSPDQPLLAMLANHLKALR